MITFAKFFRLLLLIVNDMSDIVSRLKAYMNHIGLPSTQFADTAGIPRPTISQIINGRNKKISNELISKLHEAYPTLNVLWLLFGDGDMEIDTNIEISEGQNTTNPPDSNQELIADEPYNENIGGIFSDNLQLRNSNIDEFAEENLNEEPQVSSAQRIITDKISPSKQTEVGRKIRYIMVYYNDNTFEVLTPDR